MKFVSKRSPSASVSKTFENGVNGINGDFNTAITFALIMMTQLHRISQILFASQPLKIVGSVIRAASVYMIGFVLGCWRFAVKSSANKAVNGKATVTGKSDIVIPRFEVGIWFEYFTNRCSGGGRDSFHPSQVRHSISRVLGTHFPNFSFQFFFGKIAVSHRGLLLFSKFLWLGLTSRYNALSACFNYTTPQSVTQLNFLGLNPSVETPY